jgi:hypothetical protein
VSTTHEDQEIANILVETLDLPPDAIEYDDNGKVIGLNLSERSFVQRQKCSEPNNDVLNGTIKFCTR